MSTSAMFAAIDGLVALCRGVTGTGEALENVAVIDGPNATDGDLATRDLLFIGDTLDDDDSVVSLQEFAALGAGSRDEYVTINCTAESGAQGTTDLKARRDRVKAIVAAVENLTRQGIPGADPSLGGVLLFCRVGQLSLRQRQTQDGALAEARFTIVGRARI